MTHTTRVEWIGAGPEGVEHTYFSHDMRVPLRDRAPSVRTGLCRVVVENSIALLFGEGRFPAIDCEHAPMHEAVAALIKGTSLPSITCRKFTPASGPMFEK